MQPNQCVIDLSLYQLILTISPVGDFRQVLVPQLRGPRPTLKITFSYNSLSQKLHQFITLPKKLHQPEDMNGLSVAAAGKESSARWEWEGEDGGGSLQTAAKLVQLCSVVARENPVKATQCSLRWMERRILWVSTWLIKYNLKSPM